MPQKLMRFSYAVADIADSVALFIQKVNEGEDVDESFEIVRASYKKMRSFCPLGGRA